MELNVKTKSTDRRESAMDTRKLIQAARGETPVDLLLTDARVVNVYTGKIEAANIAVSGGLIVGFGDYQARPARYFRLRRLWEFRLERLQIWSFSPT
jgi:hypothetical protein